MTYLVRSNPWNILNQIHRHVDYSLQSNTEPVANKNQWAPVVDISEKNDSYILYADIPGVDPKHIEVIVDEGILTLKGNRKQRDDCDSVTYTKKESNCGEFVRRFKLPESVDGDAITAKGELGVLEVLVPKIAQTQPRKIDVAH